MTLAVAVAPAGGTIRTTSAVVEVVVAATVAAEAATMVAAEATEEAAEAVASVVAEVAAMVATEMTTVAVVVAVEAGAASLARTGVVIVDLVVVVVVDGDKVAVQAVRVSTLAAIGSHTTTVEGVTIVEVAEVVVAAATTTMREDPPPAPTVLPSPMVETHPLPSVERGTCSTSPRTRIVSTLAT